MSGLCAECEHTVVMWQKTRSWNVNGSIRPGDVFRSSDCYSAPIRAAAAV